MHYVQIGNEAQNWTPDQWLTAAKRIIANHYDTVTFKVGDGTIEWYTQTQINAIANIFALQGVKAIPFVYSYGNTFNLSAEIAYHSRLLQQFGYLCVDMEAEWNGHNDWATTYATALVAIPGILYVSTWGNIQDQNWYATASTLDRCVNGWMPQVYTPYLQGVYKQQWSGIVKPLLPTYRPITLPHNPVGDYGLWEYSDLKDVPTMNAPTNTKGEIANFIDVAQMEIEPGTGVWESEFSCGEFVCATLRYCAKPGDMLTHTAEDVDILADAYYLKYIGPNAVSNTTGTSIKTMHDIITLENSQHYNDLTAINPTSQQASDIAQIKAALLQGYPIAATILESSVSDLDQGGQNPYTLAGWNTGQGTHLVIYTGIASDGNLLVHDSAAIKGPLMKDNTLLPQPRRYDINKIATYWATMVQTYWLPAIPANYNPVVGPALYPPVPLPVDYMRKAFEMEWTCLIPTVSLTSGIAQMAWADFKAGRSHGPATTGELQEFDWHGNPIIVQRVMMGAYIWINGNGSYHSFSAV